MTILLVVWLTLAALYFCVAALACLISGAPLSAYLKLPFYSLVVGPVVLPFLAFVLWATHK